MKEIFTLDLGVLTRDERERRTTVQTTKRYKDASGKSRFVGTSALSQSQKLGLEIFHPNMQAFF